MDPFDPKKIKDLLAASDLSKQLEQLKSIDELLPKSAAQQLIEQAERLRIDRLLPTSAAQQLIEESERARALQFKEYADSLAGANTAVAANAASLSAAIDSMVSQYQSLETNLASRYQSEIEKALESMRIGHEASFLELKSAASSAQQFAKSQLGTIADLQAQGAWDAAVVGLRQLLPDFGADSFNATVRRLAAVETPWIDLAHPEQSFGAIAALARVGEVIAREEPYSASVREAIRAIVEDEGEPPRNVMYSYMEDGIPAARADVEAVDDADALPEAESASEDVVPTPPTPRAVVSLPTRAVPAIMWAAGLGPAVGLQPMGGEEAIDPSAYSPYAVIAIAGDPYAEANRIFRIFEQSWKVEINRRLTDAFGADWIRQKIGKAMREKWLAAQAAEENGASLELIQFADLGELGNIVMRNDLWIAVFSDIKMSKEDFEATMRVINPIRRKLAHPRPLSPEDYLKWVLFVSQLLKAFGIPVPWIGSDVRH